MRRKETLKENEDDYLLMVWFQIKFNTLIRYLNFKTLMSKPGLKDRLKEIKAKIRAIDKRYEKFKEEIKLPINAEKEGIIQPATVETKIFNNVKFTFQAFFHFKLYLII